MSCVVNADLGEGILPVLEIDGLCAFVGEKKAAYVMSLDDGHDIGMDRNNAVLPGSCLAAACDDFLFHVDAVGGQGQKLGHSKPGIDLDNRVINEGSANMIEELLDFLICEDVALGLLVRFAAIEVDRIHLADYIPVITPRIEMRKEIANGAFDGVAPGTVVKGDLEIMLADCAIRSFVQVFAMDIVCAFVVRRNSREHLLECFFTPCGIHF